ncbi:MAG: hypothetical protein JWM91_4232 [Rhodospirillales bacterium]|nr:hypothetical protein [Rhodospirillales bacterium]
MLAHLSRIGLPCRPHAVEREGGPILVADAPFVTGPVLGGVHGRPFTSALVDLAASGYVEEEYFLTGTALSYSADQPLNSDGL